MESDAQSQHHLLAIALQTAAGGIPTAHVGTEAMVESLETKRKVQEPAVVH